MEEIKRFFYKVFPTYIETDIQCVNYSEADKMMREDPTWELSRCEDGNYNPFMVFICKKERVNT